MVLGLGDFMKVLLHESITNPYLFWDLILPKLKSKFPDTSFSILRSPNTFFSVRDLSSTDAYVSFTILCTKDSSIKQSVISLCHNKYVYPIFLVEDDFSDVAKLSDRISDQVTHTLLLLFGKDRKKQFLYEDEEFKRVMELFDRSIEFNPI